VPSKVRTHRRRRSGRASMYLVQPMTQRRSRRHARCCSCVLLQSTTHCPRGGGGGSGPRKARSRSNVEYRTLEALQAGCVAHLSFGGLAVCLEEVQCNGGCCREDSTHRAGDR
jgi:hypothetical protein